MSAQVILNSAASPNSSDSASGFTNTIPLGLFLPGSYEVRLGSYAFWYTTTNISVSQGNNIIGISSDSGSTFTYVTIPDGNYTLASLAAMLSTLNAGFLAATPTGSDVGAYLTGNQSTQKIQWVLTSGYEVDLSHSGASTLYLLLGWTLATAVVTTTSFAPNVANLNNGFTSFNINCSLVSYDNSLTAVNTNGASSQQTLYNDSWVVLPGNLQIITPAAESWVPMQQQQGSKITSIRISITDQNGIPLNFQQSGNPLLNASSVRVNFRRVQ